MAKYVCGYNFGGEFIQLDITDKVKLEEVKNSVVVMVLNSNSDDKLLDYYDGIRKIIKNLNKLVIILDKIEESSIKKQLCMLAASMNCYNIYECGMNDITDEYLSLMVNREASELEVEKYIGGDVIAYDEASSIILKLQSFIDRESTDELEDYITENKSLIANVPIVVDFLKRVMDSHVKGTDIKISRIQETLDETLQKLSSAEEKEKKAIIKVKSQEEELTELREKNNSFENEVSNLNKKNKMLEQKLDELANDDFSGGNITSYTPMDTRDIKGFNKYVIYFKGIGEIKYINSLLLALQTYVGYSQREARIVVYDKPHEFMSIHKDMLILNGEKFSKNPNILNTVDVKKPILVTDTNRAVLQAILKAKGDIVIIYDKLRCKDDLLNGTLVTKFYTVGNKLKLRALEESGGIKLPRDRTFTSDEGGETLHIAEIPGYKGQTTVSRVSNYSSMSIALGSNKINLFEHICNSCGISMD